MMRRALRSESAARCTAQPSGLNSRGLNAQCAQPYLPLAKPKRAFRIHVRDLSLSIHSSASLVHLLHTGNEASNATRGGAIICFYRFSEIGYVRMVEQQA